ncbi:TetR/AcrR family transcriptional regulator [Solicola gregarius]|uniref:TetR/AcrR family transcriptional regulator n=1 Tax=Solicola gregarius TaxID=2908642 RepID=A0AA46TKW8_9ACTN|nr:TetR/AcrR family transcriptional regulator [Solicola gregarius]UYM06308.1 TetR/AcrR family transcriptional regulator [Solicola gregarius]
MSRDSIDEPRTQRSRRTREALLTTARTILEEGGFDALTMSSVADRAGVTRRTAYLHFDSRGKLVTALFDHNTAAEGLERSLARVWDAPDAATAIDEWAAHLARYHPRLVAVDRAIEHAHRSDPDVAALRAKVVAAKLAHCRRLVRWLADEHSLAPDWTTRSAADMLYSLISTDLIEALTTDRGWSKQRLARHLGVTFRAAFVADPNRTAQ